MALSRQARRRLNKNKAKQRALRKLERSEAIRLDNISAKVRSNTAAIKRGEFKEDRFWKGTTQNYDMAGATSVSPQKHCEAKQRVTVNGKTRNLGGRTIANGKFPKTFN